MQLGTLLEAREVGVYEVGVYDTFAGWTRARLQQLEPVGRVRFCRLNQIAKNTRLRTFALFVDSVCNASGMTWNALDCWWEQLILVVIFIDDNTDSFHRGEFFYVHDSIGGCGFACWTIPNRVSKSGVPVVHTGRVGHVERKTRVADS